MTDSLDPIVPTPTASVNPSEGSLALLASEDFAGPVVMLNVLRFAGEEGRTAYGRYAQIAARAIASVGGALMYVGQVIEPSSWDAMALVYYPDVSAYLAMQRNQEYIDAIPDRAAGLRARLLYPFALPVISGSEAADLVPMHESGGVQAQLVRWKDPAAKLGSRDELTSIDSRGALRLQAVGSGLVTDGSWDELRLLSYPSDQHDREPSTRPDDEVADISMIVCKQSEQP